MIMLKNTRMKKSIEYLIVLFLFSISITIFGQGNYSINNNYFFDNTNNDKRHFIKFELPIAQAYLGYEYKFLEKLIFDINYGYRYKNVNDFTIVNNSIGFEEKLSKSVSGHTIKTGIKIIINKENSMYLEPIFIYSKMNFNDNIIKEEVIDALNSYYYSNKWVKTILACELHYGSFGLDDYWNISFLKGWYVGLGFRIKQWEYNTDFREHVYWANTSKNPYVYNVLSHESYNNKKVINRVQLSLNFGFIFGLGWR